MLFVQSAHSIPHKVTVMQQTNSEPYSIVVSPSALHCTWHEGNQLSICDFEQQGWALGCAPPVEVA